MSANPQKENGYTAIANEIMEALARIRINGEARQMLDVIIRKTYGFNKKQDQISTSQLVEATGLANYAIHKARHKLLKMGIIEVLPKKVIGVTQKGNSQILTYSLQKDYTKWQPLPKKVTVTQKGNALYPKKVTHCNPKSDTQKTSIQKTYIQKTIYVDWEQSTSNLWNSFCDKYPTLTKIKEISDDRRKNLKKRFTRESFRQFDKILVAIEEQPFLFKGNPNNEKHKDWRISFDWLIANDTNYLKVLEGKYKDKPKSAITFKE